MSFYDENFSIIEDSAGDIYNVEWKDGKIHLMHFNRTIEEIERKEILKDVIEGYDVIIGRDNIIYIIHQGIDNHLYLSYIQDGDVLVTCITESPITITYNLKLLLVGDEIHIFYQLLIDKLNKVYRIFHTTYGNNCWNVEMVQDIKVKDVLNPINVFKQEEKIYIVFYDLVETEELFIKIYDNIKHIWSEKIRLTNDYCMKLYLDTLLDEDYLHIVYSKYIEGNFGISYTKYNIRDIELKSIKYENKILSNVENGYYPTLIKYGSRIWVTWLEYDNLISRYSLDNGENWGSIYLWKESKHVDFVRYKYCENAPKDDYRKLNYSFGKLYPDITFMGFGPLDNVIELPLKKTIRLPRI